VTDPRPNRPTPSNPSRWSPPWTGWVRQHALFAFFVLTFLFSWLIWLAPMLFRISDAVAFRQ